PRSPRMNLRPRVLLVDDHHLVLDGLRLALQLDCEVVGEAANGGQVVEACRRLAPDVVLLDLSLPDRSGLEVILDLKAAGLPLRIIVVTMYTDRVLAEACLQAGAHGFVPKDAGTDELRKAIREVLANRQFVSPLVPHLGPRHASGAHAFELARLTPRQRQIVELLGDGKSTACIAAELHLSHYTVTFHRTRIRKVLGIDSEWGLMRYAMIVRISEAEAAREAH
ncbi:MAG TPA: response regulator transcription factor, partial [Gemmatimonadales bacterium]|nr:response regulator transcription factor [Gemmatimonadales bacterium]